MKLRYDPKADALYIQFKCGDISETDEVSPGVMLDLDQDSNPVGIEILNASRMFGNKPLTVEVELPGIQPETSR